MILDTTARPTRKRMGERKYAKPLKQVMRETLLCVERGRDGGHLFERALSDPGVSFICEVKKASPFKDLIAPEFPYMDTAREYGQKGADAMSILTESEFSLGSNGYLEEIHQAASLPILRKDLILDQHQIHEAKTLGVLAVLLICSLLDQTQLAQYIHIHRELSPDAPVRAYSEWEASMVMEAGVAVMGIDNRNLKTFEVNFSNTLRLRKLVGQDTIFVAESGTRTAKDIEALAEAQINTAPVDETLTGAPDRKMTLTGLRGNEGAISIRGQETDTCKMKICSFSRSHGILAINETLPDYIGFAFAKSSRRATPDRAKQLKEELDPRIQTVGVFVNAPMGEILCLTEDCGGQNGTIDVTQLHRDEGKAYIRTLKEHTHVPVIKVVRVQGTDRIQRAQELPCDYLFLDTHTRDAYGGMGVGFDWNMIPRLSGPFSPASGICSGNLARAAALRPHCIDVDSGVETNGRKDCKEIRELVNLLGVIHECKESKGA